MSKKAKVTEARASVEQALDMLRRCEKDLHRIAAQGVDPNSDKDKQIIGWCVTACALELATRKCETKERYSYDPN